jgi:hypothetical protein
MHVVQCIIKLNTPIQIFTIHTSFLRLNFQTKHNLIGVQARVGRDGGDDSRAGARSF